MNPKAIIYRIILTLVVFAMIATQHYGLSPWWSYGASIVFVIGVFRLPPYKRQPNKKTP